MPESEWREELPDEAALIALAQVFSRYVQSPCTIYLTGELGAGKTTFARAFIQGLGFTGRVKSPSYGLLESYHVGESIYVGESIHVRENNRAGPEKVLHLDLYRIEDPAEIEYLALTDLFDSKTLLLVEWPDKGDGFLPPADVELVLGEQGEQRYVRCLARSSRGTVLSAQVSQNL